MSIVEQVKKALMLYDTIPAVMHDHMGTWMPNYNDQLKQWVERCAAEGISEYAFDSAMDIRTEMDVEAMDAMGRRLLQLSEEQQES